LINLPSKKQPLTGVRWQALADPGLMTGTFAKLAAWLLHWPLVTAAGGPQAFVN